MTVMGSMSLFFALFVAITFVSCETPYSQCWDGDSDCPRVCPPESKGSLSLNTHLRLYNIQHNKQFISSMIDAQSIVNKTSNKEIIRFDIPIIFHSTLNYFCCYSEQEISIIRKVLANYEHKQTYVDWTTTWCNVDGDNKTIYVHADASEKSQQELLQLVRGIESDVEKQGVKIWTPRRQKFHSTIVRVTHEYPTNKVMEDIKQHVGNYGTTYSDRIFVG
ncbi:hypothetical protein AKO1_001751 [Acrasis kona]|uniref:Uncharacterized protein n=1 Tax=Acrasis kona TaxID=1008807 RepID=A0AAW2Z8G2_9EUKA